MVQEAVNWLSDKSTEIHKSLSTIIKNRKKWRTDKPALDRNKYNTIFLAKKWDELVKKSDEEIIKREKLLQTISQESLKLVELIQELNIPPKLKKDLPGRLTDLPNWSQKQKDLVKKLQKEGLSKKNAEIKIAELEKITGNTIIATAKTRIVNQTEYANQLYFNHLSKIAAGYLATAVAKVNTVAAKNSQKTDVVAVDKKWISDTESSILDYEKEIWNSLGKSDFTGVKNNAKKLSSFAQQGIEKAATQTALSAQRRKNKTATEYDEGFDSVRIGNLNRSLIQAIVLSHYVSWLAVWGEYSPITMRWVKAAGKLDFSKKVQNSFITVDDFVKQKNKKSDSTVNIAGTIKSVKIQHLGKTAISSAELVGNKGASITLALKYIKLDSSGMVPGSFVQVTGVYTLDIEWLKGNTAIVIDRENYSQLKKESGIDWVTSELRRAYDPVPHSLNAEWSWEPGTDGAGNPLRYGVWCIAPASSGKGAQNSKNGGSGGGGKGSDNSDQDWWKDKDPDGEKDPFDTGPVEPVPEIPEDDPNFDPDHPPEGDLNDQDWWKGEDPKECDPFEEGPDEPPPDPPVDPREGANENGEYENSSEYLNAVEEP